MIQLKTRAREIQKHLRTSPSFLSKMKETEIGIECN